MALASSPVSIASVLSLPCVFGWGVECMPGMLASALFITRGECCRVRKEKERKKKRGRERDAYNRLDVDRINALEWWVGRE